METCYINCIGNNACAGNTEIDGSEASTVSLYCEGKDSCKGNVEFACGDGDCSLNCVNATSCESIDVDADEASSFGCTGYCDVSEDIPESFGIAPAPGNTADASAEGTTTTSTSSTSSTSTTSTTEQNNFVDESSLSLYI